MGITWPEIDRRYSTRLAQACESCGWHRGDLHQESGRCPECKRLLRGDINLRFGGLTVSWRDNTNQFEIAYPHRPENGIIVQDADMPEFILFMLRNWKPWDEATKSLFARLGLPLHVSGSKTSPQA